MNRRSRNLQAEEQKQPQLSMESLSCNFLKERTYLSPERMSFQILGKIPKSDI